MNATKLTKLTTKRLRRKARKSVVAAEQLHVRMWRKLHRNIYQFVAVATVKKGKYIYFRRYKYADGSIHRSPENRAV